MGYFFFLVEVGVNKLGKTLQFYYCICIFNGTTILLVLSCNHMGIYGSIFSLVSLYCNVKQVYGSVHNIKKMKFPNLWCTYVSIIFIIFVTNMYASRGRRVCLKSTFPIWLHWKIKRITAKYKQKYCQQCLYSFKIKKKVPINSNFETRLFY
jgi:hypothetical protein